MPSAGGSGADDKSAASKCAGFEEERDAPCDEDEECEDDDDCDICDSLRKALLFMHFLVGGEWMFSVCGCPGLVSIFGSNFSIYRYA